MMAISLYGRKACLFILFVVCVIGCKDDPHTLRSDDNEFYYIINNRQTTNRVASIMYNKTDTANPVERFKLVHISDAHVSDWSSDNHYKYPNNLIEAVTFSNQSELKINALAVTGDHISGAKKKSNALTFMNSFYTHLYTDSRVPTFPCYGNHDSNVENEYISSAELAKAFNNRGNYPLQRKLGKSYFYADVKNPMGGMIRFVALDMLDQQYDKFNTLFEVVFSQEQVDWLCHEALQKGMTEQHSVIILTHFPFQPYGSGYLCDGGYINGWEMVPEIIEAFRSKQSVRKEYKGKNGHDIAVDVDFSTTPGDFICHLGGHAHVTAQFEVKGLSNHSPDLPLQQMLLCTNMSPSERGTVYNSVYRFSESVTNNSFCIYAIDTIERQIYVTFFGAYLPYTATIAEYPDIFSIAY